MLICSYNLGDLERAFYQASMKSLLPQEWMKRHWRGDLPLSLSFWGMGAAGIAFLFLWAHLIDPWFLNTYDPYLNLVGLFARYVATLATLTWWSVGTWRSAAALALRSQNRVWSRFSKLVICLIILREIYVLPFGVAPIFADAISNIEEDPQWGPRGVREGRRPTELEVYGAITRSVPQALELALQSNPKFSLIRLSSKGGRAGAAYAVRSIIRSRGLDTLVSTECSSFCVVAFLGGKRRWMLRSARIGFHSATFGGQQAHRANEIAMREMEDAGISKTFLQKAFSIPSDSIWYPSIDDLKDAGVVTDPLPDEGPTPLPQE